MQKVTDTSGTVLSFSSNLVIIPRRHACICIRRAGIARVCPVVTNISDCPIVSPTVRRFPLLAGGAIRGRRCRGLFLKATTLLILNNPTLDVQSVLVSKEINWSVGFQAVHTKPEIRGHLPLRFESVRKRHSMRTTSISWEPGMRHHWAHLSCILHGRNGELFVDMLEWFLTFICFMELFLFSCSISRTTYSFRTIVWTHCVGGAFGHVEDKPAWY